jgi:peroxiredoxin
MGAFMNRNLGYALSLTLILAFFVIVAGQTVPTAQRILAPGAPSDPFETYVKVGGKIPQFSVTMLDGKRFDTAQTKGKVLVLNLWATWCGPCKQEMPRLEKEIWKISGASPDLAMVAIAREETNEKIAPFRKQNGYTLPMAADPDRGIFKLFASAGIPRTYLVGRDGTILYQSLGYNESEFNKLKTVLEAEIRKK